MVHPHSPSADKDTQVRLLIAEEVDRAVATLPPEGDPLDLKAITFEQEHSNRGKAAVLYGGTIVGTSQRDVVLVPERTRQILDVLDIPFRTVPLPT